MKRANTALEITKILKRNGLYVSKSEGRNSGSVIVKRTKGFNVTKNKKFAKYNGSVIEYFKINTIGINPDKVAEILKKEDYIVLKKSFGTIYLAGKKIR